MGDTWELMEEARADGDGSPGPQLRDEQEKSSPDSAKVKKLRDGVEEAQKAYDLAISALKDETSKADDRLGAARATGDATAVREAADKVTDEITKASAAIIDDGPLDVQCFIGTGTRAAKIGLSGNCVDAA